MAPMAWSSRMGEQTRTFLDGLVIFIKRMQAKGVHVGLWSRHAESVLRREEFVNLFENYLSRSAGSPVGYYQAAFGNLPPRRSGN